MKYKIGDKVKIKSWEEVKKNIFENETYPQKFLKKVEKECGKIYEISRISTSIDVDKGEVFFFKENEIAWYEDDFEDIDKIKWNLINKLLDKNL